MNPANQKKKRVYYGWIAPHYLVNAHEQVRLLLSATVDYIFISLNGEYWGMAINVHCPGENYTWARELTSADLYNILDSAQELDELKHKMRFYNFETLVGILNFKSLPRMCIHEWIINSQKILEIIRPYGGTNHILHWRYLSAKAIIEKELVSFTLLFL